MISLILPFISWMWFDITATGSEHSCRTRLESAPFIYIHRADGEEVQQVVIQTLHSTISCSKKIYLYNLLPSLHRICRRFKLFVTLEETSVMELEHSVKADPFPSSHHENISHQCWLGFLFHTRSLWSTVTIANGTLWTRGQIDTRGGLSAKSRPPLTPPSSHTLCALFLYSLVVSTSLFKHTLFKNTHHANTR